MNLKKILLEKNITQKAISKQIGIPMGTLSRQMNGHEAMPLRYRKEFCELLGISLEELNDFNSRIYINKLKKENQGYEK